MFDDVKSDYRTRRRVLFHLLVFGYNHFTIELLWLLTGNSFAAVCVSGSDRVVEAMYEIFHHAISIPAYSKLDLKTCWWLRSCHEVDLSAISVTYQFDRQSHLLSLLDLSQKLCNRNLTKASENDLMIEKARSLFPKATFQPRACEDYDTLLPRL